MEFVKEPKFRVVPVASDGSTTEYVSAVAHFQIETGMSEVPGTLTPYRGMVLNRTRTKVIFQCVGANYSRTRGLMESWLQQKNAS
jgi:hypothetical protein